MTSVGGRNSGGRNPVRTGSSDRPVVRNLTDGIVPMCWPKTERMVKAGCLSLRSSRASMMITQLTSMVALVNFSSRVPGIYRRRDALPGLRGAHIVDPMLYKH